MRFLFEGTLSNLIDKINEITLQTGKDIHINCFEYNRLEIGFQRLSHSGGRFLVADVTSDGTNTILSGTFINFDSLDTNKSKPQILFDWLFTAIFSFLFYLLWFGVPLGLWLLVFKTKLLWIPILLSTVGLILQRKSVQKDNKNTDQNFIRFMTDEVGCAFHLD